MPDDDGGGHESVSAHWGGGSDAIAQTGPTVGQTINALNAAFPGVQIHESGGRVRAVYGVPMTQGATPKQAAQAWLSQYAPVFGEPEPALPEHSVVKLKGDKTVISYSQTVDGVPVMNGLVTVVVLSKPTPTVVSASARIAIRPAGGLSPTTVLGPQAQLIAQAHPAALGLNTWRSPEMIAWWHDSPEANPEAVRVWKCEGWAGSKTRAFLVNVGTGAVLHHYDPLAHFDVSGTISAYITPGLSPHTAPFMTSGCPSTPANCCANGPTSLVPLANLLVRAIHPTTEATLYETFTASNGTYSLPVPNGTQVKVRALLEGQYWQVKDGQGCTVIWPVITTPVSPETSATGTAPFTWTGVLNSAGGEFRTAEVNALVHTERTWTHFISRIAADGYLPGLHDLCRVVTNYSGTSCGPLTWGGAVPFVTVPPGTGAIGFTVEGYAGGANGAYSTVISHEYGHFLSWRLRNIDPGAEFKHRGWSEGYADSVAHLVYNTPKMAEKIIESCNYVLRMPLDPGPRLYPKCDGGYYDSGMVLSGAWLSILSEMLSAHPSTGLELTRQLHVDWSMLMMGGEVFNCPVIGNNPQAAYPQTIVEVLTADDTDGNLSNGTPHQTPICNGFAVHCIFHSTYCPGSCGSRPATGCPVDCDSDGRLTTADFMCFRSAFAAGSTRAECDGNGRLTIGDFTCFQERWAHGCP